TFAASRAGLEPAGLGSRVAEVNAGAVRAALAAREAAADGPVVVAGSMSSFCPAAMQAGEGSSPPGGRASDDPRFPGPADFREPAPASRHGGSRRRAPTSLPWR